MTYIYNIDWYDLYEHVIIDSWVIGMIFWLSVKLKGRSPFSPGVEPHFPHFPYV